jgi:5-formyltetrahydrofolate cyclo-ligase
VLPAPAPEAPKAEWRRWATSLPPVDPEAARHVVEQLARLLTGLDGPVLSYCALYDEVPIDGAVDGVVALPRLAEDGVMALHLHAGPLEAHRFGITQPPAGSPAVAPAEVAAVLVPGRVFDRDGYRLGRGGGHYDRLLPTLSPGTPVIGVTVEDRLVDRLPREPHDQPMTHLVTEHGSFSTRWASGTDA